MRDFDKKFEILNCDNERYKRLVIYMGQDGEKSEGFKMSEKELYSLLLELDKYFKGKEIK
jgi:hypothetical protein